ncbi:17146_t:CDS:1, partial [Racocetra fulgida]
FGGIGNTILYIIYEHWKNQYDDSLVNSEYFNGSTNIKIKITTKTAVTSANSTNETSSYTNATDVVINQTI